MKCDSCKRKLTESSATISIICGSCYKSCEPRCVSCKKLPNNFLYNFIYECQFVALFVAIICSSYGCLTPGTFVVNARIILGALIGTFAAAIIVGTIYLIGSLLYKSKIIDDQDNTENRMMAGFVGLLFVLALALVVALMISIGNSLAGK